MSQSSILTDMFANSSASINALLAQMQNTLSNDPSAANDFSCLLSNTGTSTNIAACLTAQTDAVTASPVSMNDTSVAASTSLSSTDSSLKNMQNLSEILHKAMDLLRQQKHKNADNKTQTSTTSTAASNNHMHTHKLPVTATTNQSTAVNTKNDLSNSGSSNLTTQISTSTQSSTVENANNTTNNTADVTAAEAEAGSAQELDAPTIEKLIAELLLLTQKVIKNLQQTPNAAATVQNTASSTGTKNLSDLQDLLASLTGGVVDSTSNDLAAQISSSPDAFQKLVALLQTAAKQITTSNTDTDQDNTNTSGVASSNLTTTLTATINNNDLTAQLATISARLKDDFPTSQKQGLDGTSEQIASAGASPTGLAATTAVAKTTAATASATASQNAAVTLNSNTAQNQNISSDTSTQPLTTFIASKTVENAGGSTENESSMHGGSGANSFDTSMMLQNETGSATGTASFVDHLASIRLTSTAVLQQPSPVDQAILQMSRSLKNGNDQMSLQLHPADLGKITVKLDFTGDGKVQGSVTADNPKTLELLQKDSRSLERALQDAGLRADPGSLSFNLGNPTGQNNGQTAAGKNAGSGFDSSDGTISADEDRESINAMSGAETYYITPTGVNITV